MKRFKLWLSAFRLRTLPLSISGIIIGSCFGFYNGHFSLAIFTFAVLTTISLQILSNLANDYGDGTKGTDNEDRVGPTRAIQSGEITPDEMIDAIKLNIIIVILLVMTLLYLAFGFKNFHLVLIFIVLAGLSIYAAMNYTMGASAYGYKGKGDIFVFLFFGLLSVMGSYFLYTLRLDHHVILPSIALGLLCVGVLNVNNMRDIESDRKSKKMTVAVNLGIKIAKIYHNFLILGAVVVTSLFIIFYYSSPYNLLVLIAFVPLLVHLHKINKAKFPDDYDSQLKPLALSTFVFSILIGLGYILKILI